MTGQEYREQQNRELRERIEQETTLLGGVIRWRLGGNIVPPCVLKDAGLPVPSSHQRAYDAHIDAAMAEYRAHDRPMSGEELAEARAAFGPGRVIVDIVTGRRTRL